MKILRYSVCVACFAGIFGMLAAAYNENIYLVLFNGFLFLGSMNYIAAVDARPTGMMVAIPADIIEKKQKEEKYNDEH